MAKHASVKEVLEDIEEELNVALDLESLDDYLIELIYYSNYHHNEEDLLSWLKELFVS